MNINPVDIYKFAQETQTSLQSSKIQEDNLPQVQQLIPQEIHLEIRNELQFDKPFETQIIPQKVIKNPLKVDIPFETQIIAQKTEVDIKETQTSKRSKKETNLLRSSFVFELHLSPKPQDNKQLNKIINSSSNHKGSIIISIQDRNNQDIILFQPEGNELQQVNNLKRQTTSGQNSDLLVSRSTYKKSRILSNEEYINRPEGLETERVHNDRQSRQVQSSNKSKNNYFIYMDGPIIPGSFKKRKTNEITRVKSSISTPKVQPSQKSIQNRRNISPSPIIQENLNNQTIKSSNENLTRQISPLIKKSSNDNNQITAIKNDNLINEGTQTQIKNIDYQTEFSSSKYTSYNRRHSATQTNMQFSENVPNDKLIHLMHRTQTQEQTTFQQSSKPPRPTTATQQTQSTFNESNSQQRFMRSNQNSGDYMRQSQNLLKTDLQPVQEYFLISKSQLRRSPTLTTSDLQSLPGFPSQGGRRIGSHTILHQNYISDEKDSQLRKNIHAETSSSPFLIYGELQVDRDQNRYYSQSGSRQSQYFVQNYPFQELGRVYGTKYNHERFWSLGESRKLFQEKTVNKHKWKKFIKIKDVKLVQSRVANLKIKTLIKQNEMQQLGPYDIKQETPKVKLKKFKIQWK